MMQKLLTHPVLLELIERDFDVTVNKEGAHVDGFYKSGMVHLVLNEKEELIAHTRYNQENTIESLEDLISLNYEWWQISKNRSDHWLIPECKWGDLMAEFGLVKKRTEQVVIYE